MLIIRLAILAYVFNNSIQFDKTYFIHQILNNRAYNVIYGDYLDANSASRIRD